MKPFMWIETGRAREEACISARIRNASRKQEKAEHFSEIIREKFKMEITDAAFDEASAFVKEVVNGEEGI